MNAFLKLIDTNEPSNIRLDKGIENLLYCEETAKINTGFYQNKLLVLCSDEEFLIVNKGEPMFDVRNNSICFLLEDFTTSGKYLKKVITTNSPTITPNCYFSEERVKEFVDYWNKWKELPKFDISTNTNGIDYWMVNNILQIKWLPKEEKKVNIIPSKIEEDRITIYGAGTYQETKIILDKDRAMFLLSELHKFLKLQ
jgi:hypothetical protein